MSVQARKELFLHQARVITSTLIKQNMINPEFIDKITEVSKLISSTLIEIQPRTEHKTKKPRKRTAKVSLEDGKTVPGFIGPLEGYILGKIPKKYFSTLEEACEAALKEPRAAGVVFEKHTKGDYGLRIGIGPRTKKNGTPNPHDVSPADSPASGMHFNGGPKVNLCWLKPDAVKQLKTRGKPFTKKERYRDSSGESKETSETTEIPEVEKVTAVLEEETDAESVTSEEDTSGPKIEIFMYDGDEYQKVGDALYFPDDEWSVDNFAYLRVRKDGTVYESGDEP